MHTDRSGRVFRQHTNAHPAGPASAVYRRDQIEAGLIRPPDRRAGIVQRRRLPINEPAERTRPPTRQNEGPGRAPVHSARPKFRALGRKENFWRPLG